MNEVFGQSAFFGIGLSLTAYWFGCFLHKKTKLTIVNPMLVSMILIVAILLVAKIPYEVYDYGAHYISFFLTPATICFALPLYRQMQVLRKNVVAILAGVLCGCIAHALVLIGILTLAKVDHTLAVSLLSKSVTLAIASGLTEELGGSSVVIVIGVMVAGLTGAILGPGLLKLFRIREPEAQGLAIGTCSHALGTSKTYDMGEIQMATSSLAIVIAGLLTVLIAPLAGKML